jgi:hypothetical protein
MRIARLLGCVFAISILSATTGFGAEWRPRGVVPTTAVLGDVVALAEQTSGSDDASLARRHERWTYVNGSHQIAVRVAVRDDDFRTSLDIDGLTYDAGRIGGDHWRADGNGIVHGVGADLQGDSADRAPQAVFRINWAACTLVGESQLPARAWVLETHPESDKPVFLSVDAATGEIVREVLRDGRGVVTTTFDQFEPMGRALRARHWRVTDGDASDTLDVTVDAVEPGDVSTQEVAFPTRRVFAPTAPLAASVDLPALFNRDRVSLKVGIDGAAPQWFVLDSGTTSITVDPGLARGHGTTLQHAAFSRLTVGPLQLDRASTLTVPIGGFRLAGILGFDFFFGHVIEVDYLHERVRVLSADDAATVFADPKTIVLAANVDQGLPLVHAGFGGAQSDAFAIDTGSPRLYVMRPFMEYFANEIAAHWTPSGGPFVEHYLEGGIELQPYRVTRFDFANTQTRNLIVGGQIPTTATDDLAIPFDGIIGTDTLRNFDVYFDYDNERLGLRR